MRRRPSGPSHDLLPGSPSAPRSNLLRDLLTAAIFMALALGSKIYPGPGAQLVHRYLGDLFIVSSLYFFISMLQRRLNPLGLAALVFSLAGAVELIQLTPLPTWAPPALTFWIGSTFDPWDLLAYALGAGFALSTEAVLTRSKG